MTECGKFHRVPVTYSVTFIWDQKTQEHEKDADNVQSRQTDE